MSLTLEQKACNADTYEHINKVQYYLMMFVKDLMDRALVHDQSKLRSPEVEQFTELTPKLATCTYGSQEYEGFKTQLGEALKYHYAKNRHHPEHFENGIDDMNLLDLIEMFCDWKAATLRHNDGNLLMSIKKNAKRFDMTTQLVNIFENTAQLIEQENGYYPTQTSRPQKVVS